MKKINVLVTLFLIMVLTQSQLVYAAETNGTTYHNESTTQSSTYTIASVTKESIAESLIDMFQNNIYQATIVFPKDDVDDLGKLKTLVSAVYNETFRAYPEEANYRKYSCRLAYSQDTESIYCSFTFNELTNSVERKNEAEESAKKFLTDLYQSDKLNTNMCEYQRARIISEQLRAIVSYEIIDDYSGTAWSVFNRGTAHCQGYTSAYNMLLKLDGIKCKGITGNTSQGWHMWTTAQLDGKEYQIDITWNKFGLSESEMTKIHNNI